MSSWKNLAIASILTTAVFGVMVACGSDDSEGGGDGGSAASGTGGGTGGSAAGTSGGSGGGTGGGTFIEAGPGETSTADVFDPDAACAATTVTATLTAANLLFLIDRTGSMNCNPPPDQTTAECDTSPVKKHANLPSKWEITRDALTAAWQGLQNTDPLPSVGVMLFNNDDYCGFPSSADVDGGTDYLDVAVAGLSAPQLNQLELRLNAVTPKGSTPIIGSTLSAYQYWLASGANFEGNKFVVLLTDGAETCDLQATSKAYLIQKAQEAANVVGIKTFVLGAPGSESERAFLSQIAFAGGTASDPTCEHSGSAPDVGDCHMDMTLPGMNFAQELQSNLEAISGEALSCEFDVPQSEPGEPPVDTTKVNVLYTHGDGTDEKIYQDPLGDCSDSANEGWQYVDAQTKILLCAGACAKVKADNQASVSIQLGCRTETVPK